MGEHLSVWFSPVLTYLQLSYTSPLRFDYIMSTIDLHKTIALSQVILN